MIIKLLASSKVPEKGQLFCNSTSIQWELLEATWLAYQESRNWTADSGDKLDVDFMKISFFLVASKPMCMSNNA